MAQMTENNRPICIKCKKNPALTLMDGMWICGQCLHEYVQSQIKLKQRLFLQG